MLLDKTKADTDVAVDVLVKTIQIDAKQHSYAPRSAAEHPTNLVKPTDCCVLKSAVHTFSC